MHNYLELLNEVLDQGKEKSDRTQTGTYSLFGRQLHFDLQEGFPLLTTKKVFLRGIIHELLWFISGDTNIKYLVDNNVSIWNEWPFQYYLKSQKLEAKYPKKSEAWQQQLQLFVEKIRTDSAFAKQWGELGPVYGKQWRNFSGIDQLQWVINEIKHNPQSRRLIVSAWNPAEIAAMQVSGLPPCHTLFQFYVSDDNKLSCQLYQRSADLFLGVPFNIASYALLTLMVAQVCHLSVGNFVHTFGDVHLYNNHVTQAEQQLTRTPGALPNMQINPEINDLFAFQFSDFTLQNYHPASAIKASVAV